MTPWIFGFGSLALSLGSSNSSLAFGFNESTISQVRSNMLEIATASWELGTAAEALTEISWPALSVFSKTAFPPLPDLVGSNIPVDVLAIANKTVSAKPADSLPLVPNQGSAADPASIGVSVLLANWTRSDVSDTAYADAATGQLEYLLDYAPRSMTGAISHRSTEVQLWSDFVYMVPPFISYFGALSGGSEGNAYLQMAYDQLCRLYRDGLRDEPGLWRHIAQGSFQDTTHWATGNAWAAVGMMRVLVTLHNTESGVRFREQQEDLEEWIQEILVASWGNQTPDGALRNVIDDPRSFADMASTALMAPTTYRLAIFRNDATLLSSANRAFNAVKLNVDGNGWLLNVVDPMTFHKPLPTYEHSPEGQAFVLLLQASWEAVLALGN